MRSTCSHHQGRIDANDGRVIQALADVATIGLLQQRAIVHGEILTEQLQIALRSRVAIEQAKGTGAHAWRFRGRGVRPDADARRRTTSG